jgi:hypothetical protein
MGTMKALASASIALAAFLAAGPPALPAEASQGSRSLPPGGSLCRARETVLFECDTGRKTIAVCGGDLGNGRNYVQYRYGRPGRLELEYPSRTVHAPGAFTHASRPYSGGGEGQIRFVSRGVEYVVYSRVIRTGFGPDGHHDAKFEDGVFVLRGGRLVSHQRCLDPPSLPVRSSLAPRYMRDGTIVYPD